MSKLINWLAELPIYWTAAAILALILTTAFSFLLRKLRKEDAFGELNVIDEPDLYGPPRPPAPKKLSKLFQGLKWLWERKAKPFSAARNGIKWLWERKSKPFAPVWKGVKWLWERKGKTLVPFRWIWSKLKYTTSRIRRRINMKKTKNFAVALLGVAAVAYGLPYLTKVSLQQTVVSWIEPTVGTPIAYMIWFAGLVTTALVTLWLYSRYKKGLRMGPVVWHYAFRPIVCVLAGLLLSGALWAGLQATVAFEWLVRNPMPWWLALLMAGGLAIYFSQNEKDGEVVENVPGTKLGALVTLFGAPLPGGGIIRTSGDYRWTGEHLFLGRSQKVSENGTDENGFVKLGDIQIPIWNASDKKGETLLSMVAKNRAAVFGTLMIVIKLGNPRLWLDSEDPTLDIADRARQAYRQIVDILVDTDLPSVHTFLPRLLRGATIITAFIGKSTPEYKKGAMARSLNNLLHRAGRSDHRERDR